KPVNGTLYEGSSVEINWSVSDSGTGVNMTWYTKDSNTTKNYVTGEVNNTTATFGLGTHHIIFYVNDSDDYGPSAVNSSYVSFIVNMTLNKTKELDEIEIHINNTNLLKNITLKHANGTSMGDNENANKSFLMEMEVNSSGTFVFVKIVKFNGLDANWDENFDIEVDNASVIANNTGSNAGTKIKQIVVFKKLNNFLPDDKYDKGTNIFINHSVGSYDVLYIEDDTGDTIYKLGQCYNNTAINCTNVNDACYTNTTDNVTLYIPHLSGGALGDDTVGPTINMTSPENNSEVDNSYFTFTFTAKESNPKEDFCWYNLTNSTGAEINYTTLTNNSFSWVGTTGTYTTTLSGIANSNYDMTINCTDLNNQSTQEVFNFSVSDTTSPQVTDVSSSDITTGSATLSVTTDESSICRYNDTDGSYLTMDVFNTTGGTTHTAALTGLSSSTQYTYYVRCNDTAGNIMTYSNSTTFTTSAGETTTTVSGGGGGSSGGDTTTTTVEGEEATTTIKEGPEEDEEGIKEEDVGGEKPFITIPGLPEGVNTQLLVSLVFVIIFIGAIAYWKREEIFNMKKKRSEYSYGP
ncbi:MAG: hypothetical protein KAT37_00685, partial [Candidatus Aenigmarchaeota archaeon]|nr:hypothetical protein [Candidatus Aenigmarchaeota archaeon]